MLTNILLYTLFFLFLLVECASSVSNQTSTKRSMTTITTGANIAKPGCQTKCGNLTVLYPFGIGIGSGCSIQPSFDINCDTSFDPPRPYIIADDSYLEVIDITDSQMKIRNSVAATCFNQQGKLTKENSVSISLPARFLFFVANKFMAVGCDDEAPTLGDVVIDFIGWCKPCCSAREQLRDSYCSDVGCCQTSMPRDQQSFSASIASHENHTKVWSFDPCGYAFLAEEDTFTFRISDLKRNQ